MKALKKTLGSLKKRYLRCFGVRANSVATLQGVVGDLIEDGVSRRTLVAWAVEAGYTKGYVSSLLSRILVSLGLRERKIGAGRKPSPDALGLLSYCRSQYGKKHLNVLRAAWRAGRAQYETAETPDEVCASMRPFQKPKINCGATITLARPARAIPQPVSFHSNGSQRQKTRL